MYSSMTCANDYAVASAFLRASAAKGYATPAGTTPKTYAPKQSYMGRSISFSL